MKQWFALRDKAAVKHGAWMILLWTEGPAEGRFGRLWWPPLHSVRSRRAAVEELAAPTPRDVYRTEDIATYEAARGRTASG